MLCTRWAGASKVKRNTIALRVPRSHLLWQHCDMMEYNYHQICMYNKLVLKADYFLSISGLQSSRPTHPTQSLILHTYRGSQYPCHL